MPAALSVCIVNWNTCDDLRACLHALECHPYTLGPIETTVVDNGSEDDSALMVQREFPAVVLIANLENELYAQATNQALQHATGDYVLLLNPDAQVQAGTLDTLVNVTRDDPFATVLAPRLRGADGTTQASIRGLARPLPILWDILGLARLFPRSPSFAFYRMPYFDYGKAQYGPQPMASCLLIARSTLDSVGGMDERFPLYFNDADWCERCWRAGFYIGYTPDAIVVHGGGSTTKKVRRAAVWESHRALLRYWHKHYPRTAVPLYTLLTVLVTLGAWARTGRWGESLGKWGGETTPADLRRQLERER